MGVEAVGRRANRPVGKDKEGNKVGTVCPDAAQQRIVWQIGSEVWWLPAFVGVAAQRIHLIIIH